MKLTRTHIEDAKTAKGGYTARQLRAVGVPWPPPRGWKKKLIGKEVTEYQYQQFRFSGKQPLSRFPVKVSNNPEYIAKVLGLIKEPDPEIRATVAVKAVPAFRRQSEKSRRIAAQMADMAREIRAWQQAQSTDVEGHR